MKIRNKRKYLFSIVELLIILTIIVILFSLLFPALRNTYIQSRIVSCKNNQKENSIFHHIKIDDNNNLLISALYYNESNQEIKWHHNFGHNPNGIMSAITDDPLKYPYEFNSFRCPSSPGKPGETGPNLPDYGNDYLGGDYALINIRYNLSSTPYSLYYYKAPKITDCNDPSNLVWMYDKGYQSRTIGLDFTIYASRPDEVMHLPGLHNGGKTFSFMDGHVVSYDQEYLDYYIPRFSAPPSIPGTLYDKLEPAGYLYYIDLPRTP